MHSYEVEGRGKVVVAIAGASVLLVWLLHLGMGFIHFQPQWWISVPSFAGFYSVFLWLFDHYVWKFGLLRRFRIIRQPDLNGKWIGEVASSYGLDGSVQSVSVTIFQRWSKIMVRLESKHSRSRSVIASLTTIDVPNSELSYQYVNEPKSNAPNTMEMHRGTAMLELTGNCLEGDYYTGRGRGEVGTLKLRRVC